MAKSADPEWLIRATELVQKEFSADTRRKATQQVVESVKESNASILAIVEALGPHLTCSDDTRRAQAVSLLAEVVAGVPAAVRSEGDVHHLAEFFTARLTDWPSVQGALHGCLALLRRGTGDTAKATSPGPQQPCLSNEDAAAMLRTAAAHVYVRSLAQAGRQLALEVLQAAAASRGQALLDAGLNLLEWAVASADGEKDPRCLLAALDGLATLLALYSRQPEHSLHAARLEEALEEAFDVVACYFPVSFTPPPGSPHAITRAQLAAALERALAACPAFAPQLLPLLLEKLSSTLRRGRAGRGQHEEGGSRGARLPGYQPAATRQQRQQHAQMRSNAAPCPSPGPADREAKLDSLSALAAVVAAFPPAVLAEHMGGVCVALRSELLAPAAAALLPAEVPAAEEVAAAAAACLTGCLAALQAQVAAAAEGAAACCEALAGGALGDEGVQDLESCVRGPCCTDAAAFRRSVLRVSALARVLAALAEAGGVAGERAAALLPRVLQASGAAAGPEATAAGCLAWATVATVLRAACQSALDASLLQQLAEAAAAGASGRDRGSSGGGRGGGGADAEGGQALSAGQQVSLWSTLAEECTPQRRVWLQLAVLEALLHGPQLAAALQEQQVQAAVAAALSCIKASSSSRDPLRQQGTAVLTALAGSSHAVTLRHRALPALLEAATQAGGSESALAALQGLAAASPELQTEVLIALDSAIMDCLAGGRGGGLARPLLQATAGILLAAEEEGQRAAGPQCAQLAGHLLDAALGLDAAAAASVAADAQLVWAMAEAAYYGARAADEEQQGRLAAAAAQALSTGPDSTLLMGMCSAVLAPASPGALAAALPADAGLSTALRLARAARGSAAGGAAGWLAALAAAALLNKSADAARLDASLGTLLDQELLPAARGVQGGRVADPSLEGEAGWRTLAVVTQGLAMCGHRAADTVVSRVLCRLQQLETSQASDQQQQLAEGTATAANGTGPVAEQQASAADARAVAGFFRAVLAVDDGPAALALNKRSHAVARPLWQQRLYTKASSEVLAALQASGHEPTAAPPSAPLLLTLAQLLRSAPAAAAAADLPHLLPRLLQSLDALQHEPWADAPLLEALLRQLSDFLASDAGRSAAEEALAALVPALLDLVAFRAAQAVRSAALECLLRVAALPYPLLHPYRRRVAKAAAAACDDPRRLVRLQAARVRQAWAG